MPSLPIQGAITLSGARNLASTCSKQWTETNLNELTRIVTFTVDNVHMDVHYTMGTVITKLHHPKQGYSELCRDNVDLFTLKQLFDDPRTHTNLGYKTPRMHERVLKRILNQIAPKDREAELKYQTQRLDKEISRLHESRVTVVKMLRAVQQQHKQVEAEHIRNLELEAKSQRKAERKDFKERGRKLAYHFSRKAHDFLDTIDLRNILCIIALPRNRTVLYTTRSGESSWSNSGRGIPDDVKNALLNRSNELNRPTTVAIGTHGRYFVQFSNRKPLWYGGDDFDDALIKNKDLKMVAFGPDSSSYFVLYSDGTYMKSNVPMELENCLKSRGKHDSEVEFVSLGQRNQYFVRFKDGSWYVDGLTHLEYEELEYAEDQGEIREIAFGCGGILIRHN